MIQNLDPQRDANCLERLAGGDERALKQLFDAYYPSMVRAAVRFVEDTDTARDLAQDVFVDLWQKREQLEIRQNLQGYLHRAVVNRALNHLKRRRHPLFDSAERWADMAEEDLPNAALEQENLETALHRAIENLPERCRMVFSMSRFGEMSHREIAEQLNISVKTIENQITKAVKLLREALVRHADLSAIVIYFTKWFLTR